METEVKGFTIRVYLLLEAEGNLLLSDERIAGGRFVKFPGGGLEWGEGLRDAAKREAMEELGVEVEIMDHHYTTDFFLESRFLPGKQVIAVYYLAKLLRANDAAFIAERNGLERLAEGKESFRWVHPSNEILGQLSFETDRHALRKWLLERNFV